MRRLQSPTQFCFIRKADPDVHHPFLENVLGPIYDFSVDAGILPPRLWQIPRLRLGCFFLSHRLASASDRGASLVGFEYWRCPSRCSSGVKNRTLGGLRSVRRRSSTTCTSR